MELFFLLGSFQFKGILYYDLVNFQGYCNRDLYFKGFI